MKKDIILKAAADIFNAKNVVALTGAGISVESGIPPFRGRGGVWEKFDPMEYAHIGAFMRDPAKIWKVLLSELKDIIDKAKPNDAHAGLFELEKLGILNTIITQNVDGLHQLAGNTNVIEFHGTFATNRCLNCDKKINSSQINLNQIPPKCECGGIYRPECIFFGEMIPEQALFCSRIAAKNCDIMLVIGTSALVQPASFMPIIAKESGAKIIEINPEKTPLSDNISEYCILGKAGEVMKNIIKEIYNLKTEHQKK